MSLKALSDYTFYSRYAQHLPEENRRESWEEAVERVFEMHGRKYKEELLSSKELREDFKFAKEQVLKKRVLGAQRALQYGGDPILKRHERIYNCSSLLIDKPKSFQQVVWLLMAGCGVGFSVQKHHIEKLPRLKKVPGNAERITYTIPDTCEGWADSVGVLLSSYFEGGGEFPEYEGKRVEFDFSEIRPKGALIAGQFKAPGPEPLIKGLGRIRKLLDEQFSEEHVVDIKPIVAYDILMHSSDFVISGGLRRSATICLFSPSDEEMMTAKTGDWFRTNPQRGRSNNSVVLQRDKTEYEDFKKIFESIKQAGEPGFFFCDDDYATTTNPCVTKDTTVLTSEGIKTVDDLIGKSFTAIVDGKEYETLSEGFWKTGTKDVFKLETEEGYSLRLTDNHKLLTVNDSGEEEWKELKDIEVGEKVKLNNHLEYSWGSEDDGEFEKGLEVSAQEDPSNIKLSECSSRFLEGFVQGLFKNFRSVVGQDRVDLHFEYDNYKEEVQQIQRILLSLGINSTIFDNLNGQYSIFITNGDIVTYLNRIGFPEEGSSTEYVCGVSEKELIKNSKPFEATVSSITEDGIEDVYDVTVNEVHRFDANGIVAHNCVEIGFWPLLPNGESGVNFCNLTEINGKWCTTEERFLQACRASAIIGTLQAGYNEFPYLGETTEEIVRTEALLGCSITGWMDNPDILFNEELLKRGAEEIREVNERVAKILGINPAARLTCSKPAGSTSCILKTASGIHPHHAKRYIRRVQANKQETPLQYFKDKNPAAVTESVWSANNTDDVISFMCEVPQGAITKNQIEAVELLDKVRTAQQCWVLSGNVPERALNETVTHNVSNTITVKDDEWDEVCDYIYDNRQYFTGVSLLSASGDLDYPQAPFSTILTASELVKEYGDASVFASGLIVDGLAAFDDNLWRACDVVLGIGEDLDTLRKSPDYPINRTNKALAKYYIEREEYEEWFKKVDWVRRAKQFADRYFEGNVRRMTHCLKHVSLWKKWCDLKREYVEVDWNDFIEVDRQYVDADTLASQACVGQKGCDI